MIFTGTLDLPTTLVLVLKETLECRPRLGALGGGLGEHIGSQTNAPIKSLFSASLNALGQTWRACAMKEGMFTYERRIHEVH